MSKKDELLISQYELPIEISEEKTGGFIAICPIWQDCYAQGETIEEVITEISSVATSLIEVYQEENLAIPLQLQNTAKKEKKRFSLSFPLIVSTN